MILAVFCLCTASCSLLTKKNLKVSQLNYCAPTSPYLYDSTYLPLNDVSSFVKNNPSLLKKFTYQDLLLANASGSLPLMKDLVHLQDTKADDEDSIYVLVKRQQIFNRLLLASTELASMAAELDCESERSKQLANYLDQINDTRVQRLTILSVVTGAVTGIITSTSGSHHVQVAVGISGSLISALFGGMAVLSSRKSIILQHNRNVLADIWYMPKTSTVYPPFIWYVLNEKAFNNEGTSTIIQSLKDRWIEQELISMPDKANKASLFFGNGGRYLANDLHTRASMLNQLKAEVRSINQNLQSLMLKLSV